MKPAASSRIKAVILAALVGGFAFWWYFEPFPWLGVGIGLFAALFTFYILSTRRMERLRRAFFIGLPILALMTLVANIFFTGFTSFMIWVGAWDAAYYLPGSQGLGTSPYPLPIYITTIFLGRAEFLAQWSVWETAIPSNLGEFFVFMIPYFIVLIVLGKGFCGWICPFGGLPEAMITGKKERWQLNFLKKKIVKPSGFTYYTGLKEWVINLKHGILLAIIVLFFFLPFAIINIITPVLWLKNIPVFWTIIGILVVFAMVLPFMTKRKWWCISICPVGAAFSLLNKISLFRVKIDPEKCIKCLDCVQECPLYAITADAVRGEGEPNAQCVRCGRCIEVCPEAAIDIYWAGRTKKVRAQFITLATATAFAWYLWFIVILVAYSSKIGEFRWLN
jgi:polyferredoxin